MYIHIKYIIYKANSFVFIVECILYLLYYVQYCFTQQTLLLYLCRVIWVSHTADRCFIIMQCIPGVLLRIIYLYIYIICICTHIVYIVCRSLLYNTILYIKCTLLNIMCIARVYIIIRSMRHTRNSNPFGPKWFRHFTARSRGT